VSNHTEQLHVFIGTKAQYIKTAPLLRLLDEKAIPYRLIDSGQHAEIAASMRAELGVREPDYVFGNDRDIATVVQAATWSLKIAARLWSGKRLRDEVFGGRGGICVVHGDTPSTLLSCLIAMRAGLRVAHLEAGLRSNSLMHPFPEELIRIIVMRLADICFAPTADAVENLRKIRMRGRIVPLDANTSVEAVRYALGDRAPDDEGFAIVTMHRVENLKRRERVEGFADLVNRIASERPVRFVVHEPTRLAIDKYGVAERLRAAGVDMGPLVIHAEFVELLCHAPLVVIDGGSIQEECAYIGVPTLLWRDKTERLHGLDHNVVLAHYDPAVVDAFVTAPERYRRPVSLPASAPSEQILDELLSDLEPASP
jgi:UDP-N-acetylglucosamine 2-epimerase